MLPASRGGAGGNDTAGGLQYGFGNECRNPCPAVVQFCPLVPVSGTGNLSMWEMKASWRPAAKRPLQYRWAIRWQLTDEVVFDSDVNYTIARAIDDPKGGLHSPRAGLTAAGGLPVSSGFSGGIRYRYIKSR